MLIYVHLKANNAGLIPKNRKVEWVWQTIENSFFQTLDPRLILWLTFCLLHPTPSPTLVDLTPMCAVSLIFTRRNVIMAKRASAVKRSTKIMWRQSKLVFIHHKLMYKYMFHVLHGNFEINATMFIPSHPI